MISYQICQDVACQQATVARAHCQACLRTVRKVPKKEDYSAGALAKGIYAAGAKDVPVYILHGQVSVPPEAGDPRLGIDVSYKANHYRIIFRMKNQAWQASKIIGLPPMLYFNKVSREVATQISRTQLLTNTLADQISVPSDGSDGDGEESNYANRPDDYANLAV
jgi:hypothetical protein